MASNTKVSNLTQFAVRHRVKPKTARARLRRAGLRGPYKKVTPRIERIVLRKDQG